MLDKGATRPRVLMTVPDVAWPVDGGKRLRVEAMVRAVATRCDVDLAVLFTTSDSHTRPVPPDVEVRRWHTVAPEPHPAARTAVTAALRRVPWQVAAQPWGQVRSVLRGWDPDYDLVWFGALDHVASLADDVTAERVVVDCDDVETEKWRGYLTASRSTPLPAVERLQRRVELPLWGRLQRTALARADAVLVCSDLDRDRLVTTATERHRVAVVPNSYPDPGPLLHRELSGPPRLLVVANYGTDQNVDGAEWAVHEVLPALRRHRPDLVLRLVGREAHRIEHLRGLPGVDLVGAVPEVTSHLASAHAVLVPVRFGGGTRLKLLEALSHGVPVLSTSLGAEGLGIVPGEHALVADSPEGLAVEVGRLLSDPDLAERLVRSGRALYDARFRPSSVQHAVDQLLQRLLSGHPSSPGADAAEELG